MATTKITSPDLFDLGSLDTALQLPSGTTAERPASPSTGEWRYNTTTNLIEFWDGGKWRDLQSEDIPPIPSENFNTLLWTGNGTGQSITGAGFAPDFVWLKARNLNNYAHRIFDTSRGVLNVIKPSSTGAESTDAGSLTSFDSDGFTLGNDNYVNNNGDIFVGWSMKANGGTTSSNTDGTNTSTVQVNSKAKFSIVEWNGGVSEHSVGHGLGVKPELIMVKELGASSNWNVYYDVVDGSLDYAHLNLTSAGANSSRTMWTSSVFYWSGTTTTDCVAYCFSSVSQYSKIGSYTGNGSTNGPMVITGFEPAFIMIKNVSAIYEWTIYDNKRSPSNPRDNVLYPNNSDAENTGETGDIDFLANGFQIKATEGSINQNGGDIIYIAFATDPSTAPVLTDSFGLTTYTGDGASGNSITGLSFKPSLLWIKSYSGTIGDWSHQVMDSMRGASSSLTTNNQNGQTINANGLESFDSNGFTVGSGAGGWNYSGSNYVAWAWKANTLPSINTDGAQTALVSANVAAGFSIVQLPDNAGTYTVGHGLDGVPDLIILKQYEGGTGNWSTYNSPVGVRNFMNLNTDAANIVATPGYEYDSVTATTFTNLISNSTYSYIHYCFKSVPGFSKIGSYTGTGGSFTVDCGFQPNFVMIKRTDNTGNWVIVDSARAAGDNRLYANSSNAQDTGQGETFVSNGFSPRTSTTNDTNTPGANYIFMAFKQNLTQYPIPSGQMGYLVVAGGAGGGYAEYGNGGGGGAGGLRTTYGTTSGGGASAETNLTLAAGTYTITVGGGGNSSVAGNASTITGAASVSTVGGGTPGYRYGGNFNAQSGGSGGGGYADGVAPSASIKPGGAGTTGEGFAGADSRNSSSIIYAGGGGGAAAAAVEQNGGDALMVSITASPVFYAGGGGTAGKANNSESFSGPAGTVTGGAGTTNGNNTNGQAAQANTGSGGGASHSSSGGSNNGGSGGSGIVVLRMNTSDYSGTTTGSPTVTTQGSETILTFTGSGTYVHS